MKKKKQFLKPYFFDNDEIVALNDNQLELHLAYLMAYLECEHGVDNEMFEQLFKAIAIITIRNRKNQ